MSLTHASRRWDETTSPGIALLVQRYQADWRSSPSPGFRPDPEVYLPASSDGMTFVEFSDGDKISLAEPVDFRSFELIDIYTDENAYVNGFGFERSACRNIGGDTVYTMRHEVQIDH